RVGRAEPSRDLAVRERRARRDGARDLVDPTIERRHAIQVERDGGEVARLAAQERDDTVDRALDVGRRRRFARVRKSLEQAGPWSTWPWRWSSARHSRMSSTRWSRALSPR